MKKAILAYGLMFGVIALIFIPIWVFKSNIEAKTYSRLTNHTLTTWEAMWVEARIDCN